MRFLSPSPALAGGRGLLPSLFTLLTLLGCSADAELAAPPAAPVAREVERAEAEEPPPPPAARPTDDPGPPPEGCDVEIEESGFFVRSSGKSEYVGYLPKGYDGSPTRLLVGLHGCGDSARNFAEWGVAPWALRAEQEHISIAVDGASGNGNCWNVGRDAEKVLAAIDDVARCFYVHRQKVVVGGFSSGGRLAYAVGLANATRFAGILASNSAMGGDADALLEQASWKLHVAHRARTEDAVFPIGHVRASWAKLEGAGFPLTTSEVPGGHDGTSEDWADWLIPQMRDWKTPQLD
jgi:predicted esterase